MILMIDNYDSFTYNLVQYIGSLGHEVVVYRNDMEYFEEVKSLNPDKVVISPGPGYPVEAGMTMDVIKHFAGKCPILGVCLGHQSIAQVFGGKVIPAKELVHGKSSMVKHNKSDLYKDIESPFEAGRYHSLIVEKESLPACFEITSETEDGEIMGIRHKKYQVEGVQFHPESILTNEGMKLVQNFLNIKREAKLVSEILNDLSSQKDMNTGDATATMEAIMDGEWTPAQISAFLMGLKMKGETIDEITGFVRAMRNKAQKITAPVGTVDTCGTGGDSASTFNISTAAAIVTAAAGIPVAKHGNRSVSSKCGSADVLQELGVKIDITPAQAQETLDNVGLVFLFAPVYHPSMKHAVVPRKEMGVRTVFNILGPMSNPAMVKNQIIGAFNLETAEKMINVLKKAGSEHVLLVHSEDGLDEFSLHAKTTVFELKDGEIKQYSVDPEALGLKPKTGNGIKGGDAQDNCKTIRYIFDGNDSAQLNVTVLNAGAAIYVGGKADSIEQGVEIAIDTIKSGKAKAKLDELIAFTQKFSQES